MMLSGPSGFDGTGEGSFDAKIIARLASETRLFHTGLAMWVGHFS